MGKSIFCILTIVLCMNSFAQEKKEISEQLLSRTWYTKSELDPKEPFILTSKRGTKGDKWFATFLNTGKFMHCDSIIQDIEEADGITKYARYQCDSNATYVIRGDKIKIVKNSISYYYKMMAYPVDQNKNEKLEFSILDSQLFYH